MGLGPRPTNPNPHRMGEERTPHPVGLTSGRRQCPYAGSQALPGQAVTFSASVLGHAWHSLSRVMSAVAAQMGHHPSFFPAWSEGLFLVMSLVLTPALSLLQVLRRDRVCG